MNIVETDIFEKSFDWRADKIILNVMSDDNVIKGARKSTRLYHILIDILNHDFVPYMHLGTKSFFVQRSLVPTIWKRKDLIQQGSTFYTLQEPLRKNQQAPNRLVVIFSSMPPHDKYFSMNVADRCFVQNYPSMAKHLIKNTYILRIMDLNRLFGSYYLNTKNYPTFENDVQQIINQVREKFNITHNNVVLYGGSKGGTGALYHSIIGDYHALTVDPIFSLDQYNSDSDVHFLMGVLPDKLLSIFEPALKQHVPQRQKVILGCRAIQENYMYYTQINSKNVFIKDLQDDQP